MMFTADENAELDSLAIDLTYNSILFSGLYRDLENEQWDALSKELAAKARSLINGELQRRIDALGAASYTSA